MLIGTIKEIHLYPVKSMRGISVMKAQAYWYGLNGDRKYAFIQKNKISGFPWLTAREYPLLLLHKTEFTVPDNPVSSSITIETPTDEQLPLESQKLNDIISQSSGLECDLIKLNRGTYDCMPISIMTTATLDKLERLLGETFNKERFRYNLLIDTDYTDEALLSKTLELGDKVKLQISYQTKRCQVVNLSPEDAKSSPRVLKQITQHMNAHTGVYASLKQLGCISTDDKVFLKEYRESL